MTFSIRLNETDRAERASCELILGEHKENFPVITTLWNRFNYESQWIEALNGFVKNNVDACVLVTDIQPPGDSFGISYWAVFRAGDVAVFQERFSRELSKRLIGPAKTVEPHIPPRIQGTSQEYSQVSEWTVPIDDLRRFVERSLT